MCERGGGVWEGWRCVGEVKCGGRGGGECEVCERGGGV